MSNNLQNYLFIACGVIILCPRCAIANPVGWDVQYLSPSGGSRMTIVDTPEEALVIEAVVENASSVLLHIGGCGNSKEKHFSLFSRSNYDFLNDGELLTLDVDGKRVATSQLTYVQGQYEGKIPGLAVLAMASGRQLVIRRKLYPDDVPMVFTLRGARKAFNRVRCVD